MESMTHRGIASALLAPLAVSGLVAGCSARGCGPSVPAPIVRPPAAPAHPAEEYELTIRERPDGLALELRATSGRKLGAWSVSSHPTTAELSPAARAIPPTQAGARRVTVRAADTIQYAVLVALLDACHENGVSDVAVGPPPAP